MTPRALLIDTARSFKLSGIPDPLYDSAALLSYLTGQNPLKLRLDTETELDSITVDRYLSLADRRLKREPLQYILGFVSFRGHDFSVSPSVLIPRPETALLAEWASEILSLQPDASVLDLCCGSGCIGLSLKSEIPSLSVTLADISPEALSVAGKNASDLALTVSFLESDLFDCIPLNSYNLIVSNPPYIPDGECESLQQEVMAEPSIALRGGPDGLDFYRRIACEAHRYLAGNGCVLLELGAGQSDDVRSLFLDNGFKRIAIRKDFSGIDRFLKAEIDKKDELHV